MRPGVEAFDLGMDLVELEAKTQAMKNKRIGTSKKKLQIFSKSSSSGSELPMYVFQQWE